MKKLLFALLLPFFGIFASDHLMNVNMTLGHPRMKEISSFELDYRLVETFDETSIIINPRFKPIGNGNLYSGLGFGARTLTDFGMFGYHLAWDHSYIHKSNHLQVVPSFEFFSRKWAYNFNVYMPIINFQKDETIGKIIETHFYFDHEVVYKWRYASLSFSHNFDIQTRTNGYVGKISKDVGPINVILSGGQDGHHGKHVQLSLSYSLPFATSRDEHLRINRRLGSVYACKVLQIPKRKTDPSTLKIIIIDTASKAEINNTTKLIDEGIVPALIPSKKTAWEQFWDGVSGKK